MDIEIIKNEDLLMIDIDNIELKESVIEAVNKFKAAGIYVKIDFIHNYSTTIIQAGVHSAGDEYVA
jgi:hypothetical protein